MPQPSAHPVPSAFVENAFTPQTSGLKNPRTVLFLDDGTALVTSEGTDEVLRFDATTGDFLAGRRRFEVPERRPVDPTNTIRLEGCRANNLKDVDLELPLRCLTVVTGVSGSGKSTLINDTLHRVLARELH